MDHEEHMIEQPRRRRNGLERAQWDFEHGRLWKARDRLLGLRSIQGEAPHIPEQQILDLLGEVFFAMGDLPQAGRYWFLTERSGPDMDEALAALFARYGGNAALLRVLPFDKHVSKYPAVVQERVDSLDVDHDDLKRRWAVNPDPPNSLSSGSGLVREEYFLLAVLVTIITCTGIGFVVVIRFLLGLL